MTIWQRITEALSALASGEGLDAVFDRLRGDPARSIAFTIAVIALGAKMAKADGQVTRDEVTVFRQIFHIASEDEPKAAQVFNLARQDVAGFDAYARKVAAMFEDRHQTLFDLLEGLFHIAIADGNYHPGEDSFLREVADIFGMTEGEFRTLRARFVEDATPDPYAILGASPSMDYDALRARWKELVRNTHPDQMNARGLPQEAIRLSEKRLIKINAAWEEIRKERKPERVDL